MKSERGQRQSSGGVLQKRCSAEKVFCRKGVLRNFAKFTGKAPVPKKRKERLKKFQIY